MPELRRDPVLGRWIIISRERRKRPSDFAIESHTSLGGFCPLCPGNEKTTPPEVLAYRLGGDYHPEQARLAGEGRAQ